MEYTTLKNTLDEDAVNSFIEDICSLRARGCVDAEDMLNCIHLFNSKGERNFAFRLYERWRKSQTYTQVTLNDMGDEIELQCTKYVAHYDHSKDPQKRIRYIERVSILPRIQKSSDDSDGVGA